jgi:hypothetical protein
VMSQHVLIKAQEGVPMRTPDDAMKAADPSTRDGEPLLFGLDGSRDFTARVAGALGVEPAAHEEREFEEASTRRVRWRACAGATSMRCFLCTATATSAPTTSCAGCCSSSAPWGTPGRRASRPSRPISRTRARTGRHRRATR